MKINQKGFSAVEGLLILVIVGVIGGVGWLVWQSNKKQSDGTNTPQSQKQPTSTPTVSAKYLEIKEWKVRIPTDATTERLTYEFEENSVAFRTKAYDDLVGDCELSAVSLVRGKAGQPEPYQGQQTVKQYYDQNKDNDGVYLHIGDYYYFESHKATRCFDLDEQDKWPAEDEQATLIREALEKLEQTE